jgi:hypothetical protein
MVKTATIIPMTMMNRRIRALGFIVPQDYPGHALNR